jgi:hypothetical protein
MTSARRRVPSQILLKRTPWTAAERNFYQQHVVYGRGNGGQAAGTAGMVPWK